MKGIRIEWFLDEGNLSNPSSASSTLVQTHAYVYPLQTQHDRACPGTTFLARTPNKKNNHHTSTNISRRTHPQEAKKQGARQVARLRRTYLGTEAIPPKGKPTTVVRFPPAGKMGDTEGCQRFIYSTVIESTRISTNDGYFPRDFFKLRINSNNAYSRVTRPNNNCYDFIIEFPPSSAESIQFRIAQCNHYQVVNVKVPMRNSRGIGRGYYLPYNAPVRRHVPLTSDPNFITTLLASGQNPPSITRPNQFDLDDHVSLSPQNFARRYVPLEELHVGIHCHSFNEVFFQDSYHNKTNKKYPPNQKFVDEGAKEQVHVSHHQAMLLYDNTLHQKNPFYDRQSFCNYPPDNNSLALFANPRVIRPTFPPNLSSLHVQIFPNRSTQTYDKHVHDYPIGCETDLTLVFYHEHDTL